MPRGPVTIRAGDSDDDDQPPIRYTAFALTINTNRKAWGGAATADGLTALATGYSAALVAANWQAAWGHAWPDLRVVHTVNRRIGEIGAVKQRPHMHAVVTLTHDAAVRYNYAAIQRTLQAFLRLTISQALGKPHWGDSLTVYLHGQDSRAMNYTVMDELEKVMRRRATGGRRGERSARPVARRP